MKFEIFKKDSKSKARLGKLHLPHGIVETPAFAPVGTQGTVKATSPKNLKEIGIQMILANTYHLYLRPGPEIIKKAGGLNKFMNWDKPILTDSGGYQIFSLGGLREIADDGVTFTSHLDGSKHFLTPEKIIEIELALGADIIMPLDECAPYPCSYHEAKRAMIRTTEWAKRSQKAMKTSKSTLFGIVQGGLHKDLRKKSAEDLMKLGFPGYAMGGLSVGEPKTLMHEIIEHTTSLLPEEKPRYLMGIGQEEDIIQGVKEGVDLFDCVLPTRLARHGSIFTPNGKMNIRNAQWKTDLTPPDKKCDCYTCQNFTKAYIHHLFEAREILAMILMTIHNLRYLTVFMQNLRKGISKNK